MIGDVYLVRDHGGPGLRGWLRRQLHDLITLIRSGRHTGYGHVAVEVSGGLVLDAGWSGIHFRDPQKWNSERFSVAVIRRPLEASARERLYARATSYLGQPYCPWTMLGHLLGRRVAGWLARLDPRTVICSELAAHLHLAADGYQFRRRMSADRLPAEQVRPRDIEWTTRRRYEGWQAIYLTSHGQPLALSRWHHD